MCTILIFVLLFQENITLISRLPFAVNAILNLSNNKDDFTKGVGFSWFFRLNKWKKDVVIIIVVS